MDTGATTFVPLWNYILENEILAFFRAHGRNVFVHSVVTGGQAMSDTLNGLERLAQTTSEKNVIVWLNEYFGEVTKDGKTFEEFKVAEEYAPKLVGTVVIREQKSAHLRRRRSPNAGTAADLRRSHPKTRTSPWCRSSDWRLCGASCLSSSTSWLSCDAHAQRE